MQHGLGAVQFCPVSTPLHELLPLLPGSHCCWDRSCQNLQVQAVGDTKKQSYSGGSVSNLDLTSILIRRSV